MDKTDPLWNKAKAFFGSHREVICPAFPNETIVFNSRGLNHLFYKGNRSRRDHQDKSIRIKLLPHAYKLLSIMPVWQNEQFIVDKKGKRNLFWSFEGVVDGRRVIVVVRQIGTGKKAFFSVIPSWKKDANGRRMNAKRDITRD